MLCNMENLRWTAPITRTLCMRTFAIVFISSTSSADSWLFPFGEGVYCILRVAYGTAQLRLHYTTRELA